MTAEISVGTAQILYDNILKGFQSQGEQITETLFEDVSEKDLRIMFKQYRDEILETEEIIDNERRRRLKD